MSELTDKIEKAIKLARYEQYKGLIEQAESLAEKGDHNLGFVEPGHLEEKWRQIATYYKPLFEAKSMAKDYGFSWNTVKEKKIVTTAKYSILTNIEKNIPEYITKNNIDSLNSCKYLVEFLEKESSEEFLYPQLPKPREEKKEKHDPWGKDGDPWGPDYNPLMGSETKK